MAIERTGKAKEHYDRAVYLRGKEDYAGAAEAFGEVIKLLPNDAEIYHFRAICYQYLQQPEKALADQDKAISLVPDSDKEVFTYYNKRAVTYIELGENEKAKADIEKAVELEPDYATLIYKEFGNEIMERTGNKREAAVYYKKSVESGNDSFSSMAQDALKKMGM
jgi:tetratricopeptide (TPR) repeat protein